MSAESYRTSWEIRERSGAQRFSAVLYGRALPLKETNPIFGVIPQAERTLDRGSQTKRTEAMGVDWEPLVIAGHWKLAFLRSGDARVSVTPSRSISTPQEICDFFEIFARRQKELEVIWSGGVSRICDWDGFSWSPSIGPDRRWTMKFVVLGAGDRQPSVGDPPLTGKTALASLSASHLGFDRVLADLPEGFEPGFLDSLRSVTDGARLALARTRQAISRAGDLARAPADALRDINSLAEQARGTLLSVHEAFEEVAYEYQVQTSRSEDLLKTRRWQSDLRSATDVNVDAILALLDAIDARLRSVDRYVSVLPGDSLVRLAQRVLGNGADWRKIADANGITGQTVPTGVTQVVIPSAGS